MRARYRDPRVPTYAPPAAPAPHAGLLEEVSDWAIGTDGESHIAFFNRAAREALGPAALALVGRPMSELVEHADRCVLYDALTRALLGVEGTPSAPVAATLAVGDVRVAVSGVVHAIRWRGEVAGAVALVKPAAARMDARLQAAFVSLLGHELRTPLTSVRGALGLMTTAEGEEAKRAELLRLAMNGAERLQALVEDWLDLGDAEAGRLCLSRHRVAPNDVLAPAVEKAQAAAERRRVTLEAGVHTERALYGDRPRLVRVVSHLLDNALTAAPPASVVAVRAMDAPDGGVRLSVQDAGPGIPPADLDDAFGPFVRLDQPTWQRAGGLGVGLALCRALVEQHGGRVAASSSPGRTVVWCDLPAAS